MRRKRKLDQWWQSLDDSQRAQLRNQDRLTADQRADLVRAGALRRPRPENDGKIIAQLKSRH